MFLNPHVQPFYFRIHIVTHRSIHVKDNPELLQHNGHIGDLLGDGCTVVFASPVLTDLLRELGHFFGNAVMSNCSEVWEFGKAVSPGLVAEIKRARWKNYRLRYFTEELEEIKNAQTETYPD